MLEQLTSGNGRSIHRSGRRVQRKVYFTSSEQGPLENQLYAVGFDGGARSRLTKEEESTAFAPITTAVIRRRLLEFQTSAETVLRDAAANSCRAGCDGS